MLTSPKTPMDIGNPYTERSNIMDTSEGPWRDKLKKESLPKIPKGGTSSKPPKPNEVNHPAHYQSECGLEAIDVIEAFGLNFSLGNAIKYILRSEAKGYAAVDLRKAIWYLNHEAERIEKAIAGRVICANCSTPTRRDRACVSCGSTNKLAEMTK